jgi:resolvase-like protein
MRMVIWFVKVAIYCRVSTHDKGQETANQRLPIEQFARKQGWKVVKVYEGRASGKRGDLVRSFREFTAIMEHGVDPTDPLRSKGWWRAVGYLALAESRAKDCFLGRHRPEYKSSLLRSPGEARLVRTDVFVHELEQDMLETLREAMGRGLTPSSFDFDGDILILRVDLNESRKPLQEE